MNRHDIERVARNFPLIPRPQPSRPPLPQRIDVVAELAGTPPDHPDAASRLAAAHNLAALIASDCGHPELARTLCWQHHYHYTDLQPWTAAEARRALEPLVNLARLRIRAGEPDTAITQLESVLEAVRHYGSADVEGRGIDLSRAIATDRDRNEICKWLWNVTLAEGIRALARAGRWDDALTHTQHHRGIGETLLDGRQTAIVAHAMHGDHSTAHAILAASTTVAPWQTATGTCLDLLLGNVNEDSFAGRINSFRTDAILKMDAKSDLYGAKVALVILDLDPNLPNRTTAFQHLQTLAASTLDAGVATAILMHPSHSHLPEIALERLDSVHNAAMPIDSPRMQIESLDHLLSAARTRMRASVSNDKKRDSQNSMAAMSTPPTSGTPQQRFPNAG
ncbi:MAG: hypothetical protein ACRDQ0_06205 [Pseudonocardia sp.]